MRRFLTSDSPQELGDLLRGLHLEIQGQAMRVPNGRRRAFLKQVIGLLICAEAAAEMAHASSGGDDLERGNNVRLLPTPPRR